MFTIREIIQITGASPLMLSKPESPIEHLLIDSRKISVPENTLFFAIRGERHDGHQYIAELIEKGIKNFIIDADLYNESLPEGINLLKSQNSIAALQQIAAAHRKKFKYPLIAITGSNGKTIVKEWLGQLLSPNFNLVKSPKSYNSQVGVPLSVWQMNGKHQLGIFEAGISKKGEMQHLQEILQPDLGIFTNIGTAHDEGFSNRKEKIEEKMLLFKNCPLVFSLHKKDIAPEQARLLQNFEWISTEINLQRQHTLVRYSFQGKDYALDLPFTDQASLENALTCLMVLLHFNIPIAEIQKRFYQLRPVSMRLELKQGINQSYIIDDSYNNDFAGLELALNFMQMQHPQKKKVIILSDLLEIPPHEEEKIYKNIALTLQNLKVHSLIGVGEKLSHYQAFFHKEPGAGNFFFNNTAELLLAGILQKLHDSLILIKGARQFEFEKIIPLLEQKTHQTVLEVDLNAMVHNLNFYRSLLKPGTKLMAMVKAFAYGSGSVEVANLLQYHQVNYLAVAYSDEGVYLRENGIRLPIMVLNANPGTFPQLLEYNLEPEIYHFRLLRQYLDFCNAEGREGYKIHLKIDTGMRRLGFEASEISELCEILKNPSQFKGKIASIFSHLAGADEEKHTEFSLQQINLFRQCSAEIEKAIGYSSLKHILNSPGIVRFPEADFDMVRLGIGLYGIEANQTLQPSLSPISTFKTVISQIKQIRKGESVGYGRSFSAEKDMRIATIAIGYADGFSRRLSNGKGRVWIHGQEAPVIGRVCMDMSMVDISDIAQAKEGDEAIIFDPVHSIFDYARDMGTIPYEILTSISERVKRVYYMKD